MSSTILALGGDEERAALVASPDPVDVGEDDTVDAPAELFGPDVARALNPAGRGGTNDIESQPGVTPAMPIASTRKARKLRLLPIARPPVGLRLWTSIALKVSRIVVSHSTTNVSRALWPCLCLDCILLVRGRSPQVGSSLESCGHEISGELGTDRSRTGCPDQREDRPWLSPSSNRPASRRGSER
jgi:hypothetical protein